METIMPKINILVTQKWPETVQDYLRANYDAAIRDRSRGLDEAELTAALETYDILCPTVTDPLAGVNFSGRDIRTRLIANYGAGLDHINLNKCRAAGIIVTNTPDVVTEATAELAVLLMLAVARRAGEGERQLRRGSWAGWEATHLLGTQLGGKTLGLVGFGRIARTTAYKAKHGHGMRIIYHARHRAAPDEEAAIGASFRSDLDGLLAEADFVSLHIPGGGATENLIDAHKLSLMKRSAYLINTARGTIVDEEALVATLREGRIAGAGLDVYRAEPSVPASLIDMENVVLLPHLGTATREAREAMGMRVVANIEAFIAGRDPPDRIV